MLSIFFIVKSGRWNIWLTHWGSLRSKLSMIVEPAVFVLSCKKTFLSLGGVPLPLRQWQACQNLPCLNSWFPNNWQTHWKLWRRYFHCHWLHLESLAIVLSKLVINYIWNKFVFYPLPEKAKPPCYPEVSPTWAHPPEHLLKLKKSKQTISETIKFTKFAKLPSLPVSASGMNPQATPNIDRNLTLKRLLWQQKDWDFF